MTRPDLARILAEIPALTAEAVATRGTKPITTDGDHRRQVPGSVCLADLDRMIALDPGNSDDGLGVLSTWVRAIAAELDEDGTPVAWPADTVAAACQWLAERLPWMETHPWRVDGLDGDLRALWGVLRRICRITDPKPWPCTVEGCQGVLRVDERGLLRCTEGHEGENLATWRNKKPIPAPDAARLFGVTPELLRQWRQRGKLPSTKAGDTILVKPWDVIRLRWPDLIDPMEAA